MKEKIKRMFHTKYITTGLLYFSFIRLFLPYKMSPVKITDIPDTNVLEFTLMILFLYITGWFARKILLFTLVVKDSCKHDFVHYMNSKEDCSIKKCKKCGELVESYIGYGN